EISHAGPQGGGNFGLEHRSVDTDNNTLIALICRAVLLGCLPHRRGTAPIDSAESSPNVVSFATPARFPEATCRRLPVCCFWLFARSNCSSPSPSFFNGPWRSISGPLKGPRH